MKWVRVLLVAPIWGPLAARLVLQMFLAFANFLLAVAGLVAGRVERRINDMAIGTHVLSFLLFGTLLYLLHWFASSLLGFGYSSLGGIVFWILGSLATVMYIPEVWLKLRVSKRQSFVPGAIEEDIWRRKARACLKPERSNEIDG